MRQQETKLSAQAAQVHQELMSLIRQKIEDNGGMIDFETYMQQALYAPELGYYQNGLQKFGEQGDFVTAPEMGKLFAFGLANAILSIDETDSAEKEYTNDRFSTENPLTEPLTDSLLTRNMLEIGAGSGRLAADLLQMLHSHGRAPERYYILEPSASLQSLQHQTISQTVPQLLSRVTWLAQLPESFEGVIFANEVVDAIPCKRLRKMPDGWHSMGVSISKDELEWKVGDRVAEECIPSILLQEGDMENYVDGYICETRPLVKAWLSSIASSLTRGIMILFDYGYPQYEYYHPQRVEGSLRCFTRHQAHSQALELAGLQDITAHVDFSQLAHDAVDVGMKVKGFTTQAGFLLENGILESGGAENELMENDSHKSRLAENTITDEASLAKQYRLSQQIQKLTAPGQMGEIIKVICLNKQTDCLPRGFSLQSQLHRL